MGPVLLKLLREAILGSHAQAKGRAARAAWPMEVGFSPFTAILGLFAKFPDDASRPETNRAGEVEEILIELGVVGEERREAMGFFAAAGESPLDFSEMLGLCRDFTRDHVWLRAGLISFLFRLAHAGGPPSGPVAAPLAQACTLLGRDYEQSLAFYNEESAQRASEKRWAAAKMSTAYGVLGCGGEESLDAIKRRYRVLAKELHPDILAPQGLPAEDVASSAEKFREVQEAYQFVLVQREMR